MDQHRYQHQDQQGPDGRYSAERSRTYDQRTAQPLSPTPEKSEKTEETAPAGTF
jgi:hypothetical protein